MVRVRVVGRVLRWGNSYGIRVRKSDMERAGLKEGTDVVAEMEVSDRVDLSHVRTFKGDRPDVSERHDEFYAKGLWAEYKRKQRAASRRR
jgi:antitoxin component of MazEF toxin-antitoxin module